MGVRMMRVPLMTGRLSSVGGVGSGLSETVLVAFEDARDAELVARVGAPEVEDQVEDPDFFAREWGALVGGDYSDEILETPSPDDTPPRSCFLRKWARRVSTWTRRR
jgi:hypothetical protein